MKKLIASVVVLSIVMASTSACSRIFNTIGEEEGLATVSQSSIKETETQPTAVAADDETATFKMTTEIVPTTLKLDSQITTTKKSSAASTTKKAAATSTTKKTTTKPTTTKKATVTSGIEISASSVKAKAANTRVQRAWRIKSGSTTVEVHKLAYGSPEKRKITYKDVTKTMNYQEICNIAVITCPANHFKSECSEQLLNKEEGLVNDMAKSAGALVAVNCEGYTGHWDDSVKEKKFDGEGPVVKNGEIVQKSGGSCNYFLIYKSGTWAEPIAVSNSNVNSLINNGLSFTLLPQYQVIWGGKSMINDEMKNETAAQTRNRTMIGQIDSTHYVMVAGEFMRIREMVAVMLDYGVQKAFMLNGGNCSYMYLKGVGNVTGSISPKLKYLDKVNVLEQEFYGNNSFLGTGKDRPLGAACPAKDIVYVY